MPSVEWRALIKHPRCTLSTIWRMACRCTLFKYCYAGTHGTDTCETPQRNCSIVCLRLLDHISSGHTTHIQQHVGLHSLLSGVSSELIGIVPCKALRMLCLKVDLRVTTLGLARALRASSGVQVGVKQDPQGSFPAGQPLLFLINYQRRLIEKDFKRYNLQWLGSPQNGDSGLVRGVESLIRRPCGCVR